MNLKRVFSRQLLAAHAALVHYMGAAGLMLHVNTQSSNVKGQVPSPVAMGQELVPLRAELTLASFLTTAVYEMVTIPAGMKVIDWIVDIDDIDESTGAVFKVGVLNAGKTDLDTGNAIWKTGLTTGQAGGVARMDTLTALRAGASTSDRVVGIIPTTAATTFAAGVVGITVLMAAA